MSEITPEFLACLSLFSPTVKFEHFNRPMEDLRFRSFDDAYLRAREVLSWAQETGVTILHPKHPFYPTEFNELENPPLYLACRGEPVWRRFRCLSVVGSRDPSHQVLDWMDLHLGTFLRDHADVALVSGGARGIDQKAHALSLRQGRPTVVFLPSGSARPYPNELKFWESEVLAGGGCIVSEFPPLQEVRKGHFVLRNRMIAQLSAVLFVAEARRQSGSTLTARLAREASRTICVLPSFPGQPRSAGTLDLLFDGAFPIRDADDLRILFALVSSKTGVKQ